MNNYFQLSLILSSFLLVRCSASESNKDLSESSDSFHKNGKEYAWSNFQEVYFNYDPALKLRTTLGITWKDKETIQYHVLSESKTCKKELDGLASVAEYKANIKEPNYVSNVTLTMLDKTNEYMIGFTDKQIGEVTTMVIRIAPSQPDPCFSDRFLTMTAE